MSLRKIQGISVWQPERAKEKHPHAIYIITSRKYAEEIEEQLYDLEVPRENVCIYTAGIDMLLFQQI